MARVGGAPSRRALVVSVLLVVIGVLSLLTAAADARVAVGGPWGVGDLAVGLVFVVAAGLASGPDLERVLVGSVGAAWLAGSLTPLALSLHQGVLVAALVAFPSGRPTGAPRYVLLAASVFVVAQALPQWGVALVFLAVALVAWSRSRPSSTGLYPALASGGMAAALAFAWSDLRSASPGAGPYVYEGALVAVAVGYPLAGRALNRDVRRLADRVLGEPLDGLDGLVRLLRHALGDETLTVTMTPPAGQGRSSSVTGSSTAARELPVEQDGEVLAIVCAGAGALDDEPTARVVLATVRLFLRNQRLQDEQRQRLKALQISRTRLLAAADRERERTSTRLALEVGEPLARAAHTLAVVDQDAAPAIAESLAAVRAELAGAAADVQRLVAGSPPVALGQGRLAATLVDLALRSPELMPLRCEDGVEADSMAETALFYVCSEAVVNAAKHAAGAPVTIDLSRSGHSLVLTVRDEGPGGADPAGSGLLGLVDRLATIGGQLEVDSPAGQGTTVVARVPINVAGTTQARQAGRDPDDVPLPPGPERGSPTWPGRRPTAP